MSYDCLLLDVTGTPISAIPWRKAFKLYNKDKIQIVKETPARILHSQSFTMNMPTVVKLKNDFARRARLSIPCSRAGIVIRDHAMCQYCGRRLKNNMDELTFDHVLPKSRGGTTTWTNTVVACYKCNAFKADRTPEECGFWLINTPKEPSPNDPRFKFRLKLKHVKPEWSEYFQPWVYWNTELEK